MALRIRSEAIEAITSYCFLFCSPASATGALPAHNVSAANNPARAGLMLVAVSLKAFKRRWIGQLRAAAPAAAIAVGEDPRPSSRRRCCLCYFCAILAAFSGIGPWFVRNIG